MNKPYDVLVGRAIYRNKDFAEIIMMLSRGEVHFAGQLRSLRGSHWVPMLSFENFADFAVHKLMIAASGRSHHSFFNHWYLQSMETHLGPFSILQVLEFVQQKRLSPHQLVRHPNMDEWMALSLAPLFKEGGLEELLNCGAVQNIIGRRKHPRISYDNEVFISSKGSLYRGVSWSLSSGGVGVVTDDSTLMDMHDSVNVIINSNNHHGSVQMKGRVVDLKKEMNCEKVALKFDNQNEFLNQFLQTRVPGPLA